MATLFETEIREQPEALARLLREGEEGVGRIAAEIRARAPRFAVLAARGSSDNAARYGQYLLGIENGLVAALATPSLFTQYDATPSMSDALVIGVSQSGQSPDIVAVVREGRRQGAVTVAITNEPASPLAASADHVLPLLAGPERAVAATKTYTTQVLALAMLSAALRGEEERWRELRRIPELVSEAVERNAGRVALAEAFRDQERLVVLARGYNFATALEITLKVKETSGIMADGYSSADFHHGPKALLERRIPVLVVAPGPRTFEDLEGLVRLARERGAPLVAITDRPDLQQAANVALPLPAGVPEWLSPLVAAVPGQLWALGLSLVRGMQPDAPPGLSKVTHTT
ncbi:MAG TPA: SIS domain-containing protein [Vicinamibacteria bacterium]|nr:SIS domain-containing protein [Vicinamibacteria bacterium]